MPLSSLAPPTSPSSWPPLPRSIRRNQPLRHFFVIRCIIRPTLSRAAPAVIDDSHVDAPVDEELHCFVVLVKDQLVQDAGGVIRASRRCAAPADFPHGVRGLEGAL